MILSFLKENTALILKGLRIKFYHKIFLYFSYKFSRMRYLGATLKGKNSLLLKIFKIICKKQIF